MALGTFTPPATGNAGSFDVRTNHSKPVIAVVREFRPNFVTKRFPTPKDVVFVDVVDLMADTVHVSVVWGGAAIVDRLKESVPAEGAEPEALPIIIRPVTSGNGGTYYVPEPMEGTALQLAVAWDAKHGMTRINAERKAKLAADQAAAKPNGNGSGTAPAAAPQAPIQGLSSVQATQTQTAAPAAEAPAAASSGMDDAALEAALAALG